MFLLAKVLKLHVRDVIVGADGEYLIVITDTDLLIEKGLIDGLLLGLTLRRIE